MFCEIIANVELTCCFPLEQWIKTQREGGRGGGEEKRRGKGQKNSFMTGKWFILLCKNKCIN